MKSTIYFYGNKIFGRGIIASICVEKKFTESELLTVLAKFLNGKKGLQEVHSAELICHLASKKYKVSLKAMQMEDFDSYTVYFDDDVGEYMIAWTECDNDDMYVQNHKFTAKELLKFIK